VTLVSGCGNAYPETARAAAAGGEGDGCAFFAPGWTDLGSALSTLPIL
jgi:hypothetical protein